MYGSPQKSGYWNVELPLKKWIGEWIISLVSCGKATDSLASWMAEHLRGKRSLLRSQSFITPDRKMGCTFLKRLAAIAVVFVFDEHLLNREKSSLVKWLSAGLSPVTEIGVLNDPKLSCWSNCCELTPSTEVSTFDTTPFLTFLTPFVWLTQQNQPNKRN